MLVRRMEDLNVNQKWKFCHQLLNLTSFQTLKTSMHRQRTVLSSFFLPIHLKCINWHCRSTSYESNDLLFKETWLLNTDLGFYSHKDIGQHTLIEHIKYGKQKLNCTRRNLICSCTNWYMLSWREITAHWFMEELPFTIFIYRFIHILCVNRRLN